MNHLAIQCLSLKKQKADSNIMSINIIRKNTSSPFHLQRSIVPQEGGAYQRGGFNPDAVYNNDAANQAMESFSKTMGEAISNMDFKRKKKEDKGLESFKKKVKDAEATNKVQQKENQENALRNITEDIDAFENLDAFEKTYKKFSKRGK